MRILLTGMTPRSCGTTKRLRVDYINIPRMIKEALESFHHVDQRQVIPGEELDYDAVIISANVMNSINTRGHVLGWLWTIHEMRDRQVIIFLDDWQYKTFIHDCRSLYEQPEKFVRKAFGGTFFEYPQFYIKQLYYHFSPTLEKLAHKWPSNWRALCSTFPKCNSDVLLEGMTFNYDQLIQIEPSYPIVENAKMYDVEKERKHMLCSLTSKNTWFDKFKLEWPVEKFGRDRVLTEFEVTHEAQRFWSVTVPLYTKNYGFGWWRSRYVHAALAGSVLTGEPKDIGFMYPQAAYTPQQVEQFNDTTLNNLAYHQRKILLPMLWPKEKFQQTIVEIIR